VSHITLKIICYALFKAAQQCHTI